MTKNTIPQSAYKISFTVVGKLLGTVIGALEDRGVTGIHTEPVDPSTLGAADVAGPKITRTRGNGGAHNGDISKSRACQAILTFLADYEKGSEFDTTPTGPLGKALAKAGFSASSVSPTTSLLVRLGKLERTGHGKVRLPK